MVGCGQRTAEYAFRKGRVWELDRFLWLTYKCGHPGGETVLLCGNCVTKVEKSTDDARVPRHPNGDRMLSHEIELIEQGWIRSDYACRPCNDCGELCEWWGRAPIGSGGWTLFNWHTTIRHSETCRRVRRFLGNHRRSRPAIGS